MARLLYGIEIWELSINKKLLKKVQRVQNMTMCWILGLPRWTKTETLLNKLEWLSIYQLAWYYSLISIWNVINDKFPNNNHRNLTEIKLNTGRLKLTRSLWSFRAYTTYQELPDNIKNKVKLSEEKKLLKTWIKSNIPLEEVEE